MSMDGLARLRELFVERVKGRGGEVISFGVDPVSPPELSVIVVLDDEQFMDEQDHAEKDLFEALEKDLHEDKKDEQAVEAVRNLAGLAERLQDPSQGLLGDDEED